MPTIQPNEYDVNYFDGKLGNPHPGGYFDYNRNDWMNNEINKFISLLNPAVLANKKTLELGCAKGFLVEDLRNAGVDAYGIDISQYATENAPIPQVTQGDARDLSAYSRNEFDILYSVRFLECLDPADIPQLVSDMSFIAKSQIHIIDEPTYGPTDYYNLQTKEAWLAYDFPKNTKIISFQTGEMVSK